MMLADRINKIISSNEEVYWNNEFQIQLYMSRKWKLAFREASLIETGEFDIAFPPPTHVVADLAYEHVTDHELFIKDFFEVIQKLSRGLNLMNGKFE